MPENINLYTQLRLHDFVHNFNTWFNQPDNPTNPNSDFSGNDYDYVSFIPSPDAIHLIDVGRIPLDDVSTTFKVVSTDNSSGNTVLVNTPLGWKMQLGKKYSDIKKSENQNIPENQNTLVSPSANVSTYNVTPGLFGQVIQLSTSDKTDNKNLTFANLGISQQNFLDHVDSDEYSWINAFTQGYENEKPNGKIYTHLNYDNDFGTSQDLPETSFIGIEYFGYFKPETVGNYTFSINAGQDFCLMWLGNKAVCEYVVSNVDINSSNMDFKQTFLEDSYMPIRIQYFASKQSLDKTTVNQNKRIFSITVKNTETNKTLDNKNCFKTIKIGNAIHFPKFVYCAFASALSSDFEAGKFVCYSFGGLDTDYNKFFSYMKKNKKDIFKGKYDSVTTDGLVISEYGTLPNGINYTDAYNATTTIPSKLSIYRIYSDIRMGRTFQVNKTKSNGNYQMTELSNDLTSLTNEYTNFPNYYPSGDSVNSLPAVQIKSQKECLDKCNAVADSKCSYFYTYNSDNNQYCVTGTNFSSPLFNQIPSKDQTNGSLYIRGYETAKPTVQECIAGKLGSEKSSLTNTIDYTASNPYYNYTIAKNAISDFKQLGDCNSQEVMGAVSEYSKRKKEAEQILYNDAEYRDDGYYMKSPGIFSKPDYSNIPGTSSIENFDTQTTDATKDTGSNINKLKTIQPAIQRKEDAIHENLKKISKELIPNFTKTRDILKNDNKYDYNGDVLMYLRDTKIPSRDEQRLIDSSDERFNQNSIYSLGIITAATLVILGIYLGRD